MSFQLRNLLWGTVKTAPAPGSAISSDQMNCRLEHRKKLDQISSLLQAVSLCDKNICFKPWLSYIVCHKRLFFVKDRKHHTVMCHSPPDDANILILSSQRAAASACVCGVSLLKAFQMAVLANAGLAKPSCRHEVILKLNSEYSNKYTLACVKPWWKGVHTSYKNKHND